jgi:hypothetical protein
MRRFGSIVLCGAALASALACGGGETMRSDQALTVLSGIPPETWSRLAAEKFYFGHQSVGYDVVNGIADLVKLDPRIGLKVVETSDLAAFDAPVFAHSKNGENKKPDVKIAAFESALDGGLGGRVDVAFFKFCYVDITPETDVEKLFAAYRESMGRLRDRFPSTRFIHLTSPVTVVEAGPKAWAKRVLGRPLAGEEANVARSRFNALLRASYEGKEPVFDLAAAESTYPDGRQASFDWKGASYPRLIPAYSYDGRHLNEVGRQWVAAHLLRFLAELPAPAASVPVGATQIDDARRGVSGAGGAGQNG